MENTVGFLAVGGAIFGSFGVALLLEWVSLELLMKMMPPRVPVETTAQKFAAIVNRGTKQTSVQTSLEHTGRKAA